MFSRRSLRRARHLGVVATAALAICGGSSVAAATEPPYDPVAAHRAEIGDPRPSVAVLGLRQLWSEWDLTDPSAIEELLRTVAADKTRPSLVRNEATILGAEARRRRGDFAAAEARYASLGYITRWQVVGPFRNDGRSGWSTELGPERHAGMLTKHDTFAGRDGVRVGFRLAPVHPTYGVVDLGAFFQPREEVCGYALTFIKDARAQRASAEAATLWVGAAGAFRLYWNGREVLSDARYRGFDRDRHAVSVSVTPGPNRLLMKVCSDDAPMRFAARFTNSLGEPATYLEADADLGLSRPLLSNPVSQSAKASPDGLRSPQAPGNPEPALASLTRLAEHGDPRASLNLARYLTLTSGDDRKERAARTLVQRSVDRQPSVQGLLLAASLAEGRNDAAVYLTRARDLVAAGAGTATDRLALLLASADHARRGPVPRDALRPIGDALQLSREHPHAVAMRAGLFADVGLREVALSQLEKALLVHPASALLLRRKADLLSAMGRTTEAAEALALYGYLRADDPYVAHDALSRATGARNAALASHHAKRLLSSTGSELLAYRAAALAIGHLLGPGAALSYLRQASEIAPEDVDVLRESADQFAMLGQREEQKRLLAKILLIAPQSKGVREYLAHLAPSAPRADEAYLRSPAELLKGRHQPSAARRRTLVDVHVATVHPSGLASRLHQVAMQPRTPAEADRTFEFPIVFESESQIVDVRTARIHRVDGRVEDATGASLGSVDDPNTSTYTSLRVQYIKLPKLAPNDVVEIVYRVDDVIPRNVFADYFGELVYRQSREPIVDSEYVLVAPKDRNVRLRTPASGLFSVAHEETSTQRVTRVRGRDLSPLESEPLAPPITELSESVHASTFQSWSEVALWYGNLVREQLVADASVRARAHELTRGLKTDAEKIAALFAFVSQKIRYVALELGVFGYKPYRVDEVLSRGFGDCKDKASLLVSMLREVGVPGELVLVRTSERGQTETKTPSVAPFDHAIAYVPRAGIYLDATAELAGTRELPQMDQGAMVLHIAPGTTAPVSIPMSKPGDNRVEQTVAMVLSARGQLDAQYTLVASGVEAPALRTRLLSESTRSRRTRELIAPLLGAMEVVDVTAKSLTDTEQPPSLTARLRSTGEWEGDNLSVTIGMRPFVEREYASLSDRRWDVVLGPPSTRRVRHSLTIPADKRLAKVPTPGLIQSKWGSLKTEVEQSITRLEVVQTLELSVARVKQTEYKQFRAFCQEVDRALGQRATIKGAP